MNSAIQAFLFNMFLAVIAVRETICKTKEWV